MLLKHTLHPHQNEGDFVFIDLYAILKLREQ